MHGFIPSGDVYIWLRLRLSAVPALIRFALQKAPGCCRLLGSSGYGAGSRYATTPLQLALSICLAMPETSDLDLAAATIRFCFNSFQGMDTELEATPCALHLSIVFN